MAQLKNATVLITGGAGLVGSHLTDQLLTEGVTKIIVLDNFVRGSRQNLADALPSGLVEIIEGDIQDRQLLKTVMKGVDVLFHQAAIRITQCAEEPRLAFDILAGGTFNVLEAAVNAGVKKVVAASSASVYGMAEHFPTDESHHPYGNRTIYGACKTFNEGLLRSFNEMYDLDYVALRYFNVYGPRMDTCGVYTEVLIRWMQNIVNNKPPIIFGDGKQTMDFVFITDIARANVLAAKSNVSDKVLNVASGVETSLEELAGTLLEIMDSKLSIEYQAERKVNPVPRRLAQTLTAQKAIGFEAQVDLKEGLRQLVSWWQEENKKNAENLIAAQEAK
jgi:UDP-glucose 4-epimerase